MAYSVPGHGYDKKELHEANPVGIDYLVRNERVKKDFTRLIPDKKVEKERLPWGFFGYTYLGGNKQWLNELLDYTPELKEEVDVHEGIHTNDESETIYVSRWMCEKESREEIVKRIARDAAHKFYKN